MYSLFSERQFIWNIFFCLNLTENQTPDIAVLWLALQLLGYQRAWDTGFHNQSWLFNIFRKNITNTWDISLVKYIAYMTTSLFRVHLTIFRDDVIMDQCCKWTHSFVKLRFTRSLAKYLTMHHHPNGVPYPGSIHFQVHSHLKQSRRDICSNERTHLSWLGSIYKTQLQYI